MKTSTLAIIVAGLSAIAVTAFLLWRRGNPTGTLSSFVDGLAGKPMNNSLAGPFNLGADRGYDLGGYNGNAYDLSGAGQGSSFFSKPLQISVMP